MKKYERINQDKKSFTLVELLIVVAILGIIGTIGIPIYQGQIRTAQNTDAQTTLQSISMMQEQYLLENNSSTYWNSGSSCGDKTKDIGRELFAEENALNDDHFYFCIIPKDSSGYVAKAISRKDGSEFWIDYKNDKSW